MVRELSTRDELNAEFNNDSNKDKLVVVDFYATWVGACLRISPQIVQWSDEDFRDRVTFYKVDVDKSESLSQDFKIEAMPTFIFFKNGNEIYRLVGANANLLKSDIEAFSNASQ